ncbi:MULTISPECIES: GIY-YIG nuclease family protein [Streptomyces]|uniref:GIY-YIG nuclease family protein n=1 Tax=Streptomyces TaxID=1883 RepID=UPI00204E9320|nr:MULTISPECIES: GIY-YIG nuclease family protein [Streptomyces]UPT43572.1 GIY-YIG nuclease family protein [Streptomyces sp. WAC00303]WIY77758.1 GIY-YIG nuclease family protein [Streptomyces anulatus]
MTGQFSDQFRLSITEALSTQLYAALDRLEPAPLSQENLDSLAPLAERLGLPGKGVYQIFRQEPGKGRELAYVGKADEPLPDRLGRHLYKLSGREGVSIEEISFSCLFVEEDLSSVSPEKMLIQRHLESSNIVWNNRGFGNNDPGRNRDRTAIKSTHFDLEFPIDLSRKVDGLTSGAQTLHSVLGEIKRGIPFNFRFKHSAAFKRRMVTVPEGDMTVDEAFRFVALHLTGKWQICALLGWAIMYDDSPSEYPSARRYYRPEGVLDQAPKTREPGRSDVRDEVDEDSDSDE